MALTFEELHFGRSGTARRSADSWLNQDAIRLFLVPGYSEGDALTHPSLPSPGSEHPRVPGVIARQINTREMIGAGDDSGWIVQVDYARPDDPTWSGPPPDIVDEGYAEYSLDFGERTVKFPVISSYNVNTFGPNDAVVQKLTYKADQFNVSVPQVTLRRIVNQDGFSLQDARDIAATSGKIHEFLGTDWLFESGKVTHIGERIHRINYAWKADPGNPAPDLSNSTATGAAIVPIPAREPHHEYVVVWVYVVGLDQQLPFVVSQPVRDSDPTGHTTLPGSPINVP